MRRSNHAPISVQEIACSDPAQTPRQNPARLQRSIKYRVPERRPKYRLLDHRDAVDLDIERAEPFGNADEDARRRIFRKIARIDGVDGRKMLCRGAEHVALHDIVE